MEEEETGLRNRFEASRSPGACISCGLLTGLGEGSDVNGLVCDGHGSFFDCLR